MPDLKTELGEKWKPMARVVDPGRPYAVAPVAKEMPEEKATRNRRTSKPVFCRVLAERLGVYVASERLGLSRNGLRTAFDRDKISTVAEIAAKGILDAMKAKEQAKAALDTAERIVVIRVPGDKHDAFMTLCEAMQLTAKEV